jgi:hypothetical protein
MHLLVFFTEVIFCCFLEEPPIMQCSGIICPLSGIASSVSELQMRTISHIRLKYTQPTDELPRVRYLAAYYRLTCTRGDLTYKQSLHYRVYESPVRQLLFLHDSILAHVYTNNFDRMNLYTVSRPPSSRIRLHASRDHYHVDSHILRGCDPVFLFARTSKFPNTNNILNQANRRSEVSTHVEG